MCKNSCYRQNPTTTFLVVNNRVLLVCFVRMGNNVIIIKHKFIIESVCFFHSAVHNNHHHHCPSHCRGGDLWLLWHGRSVGFGLIICFLIRSLFGTSIVCVVCVFVFCSWSCSIGLDWIGLCCVGRGPFQKLDSFSSERGAHT